MFTKQLDLDKSEKAIIRLFSLRHDFPDAWHRFMYPANPIDPQELTIDLADRFPYFTKGRTVLCKAVELIADGSAPISNLTFTPTGASALSLTADGSYGSLLHVRQDGLNQAVLVPWTLRNTAVNRLTENNVSDIMIMVHYTAAS